MPLITREEKGSKLSIEEMDGNLIYLDNKTPYKVYTALLTQSGGDDPKTMAGDGGGDLTSASKGTTVFIVSNLNKKDYSSIGAPNSDAGTYFILTQNITLSDLDNDTIFNVNLGAPVVTVLENTIGNIWFTYSFLGEYFINSDNLFSTKLFMQDGFISDGWLFGFSQESQSQIKLLSFSSLGDEDSLFDNTPIEIRVYN
jgi:hypothetical protein